MTINYVKQLAIIIRLIILMPKFWKWSDLILVSEYSGGTSHVGS
jgi:hypothetical protein